MVGAGAKILGNITIEENCRVGAGSVVMRNVPKGCTVVGIPGKIVKTASGGNDDTNNMLDHGEMPDPVAKVFSIVLEKIETQQKQINKLYEDLRKVDSMHIEDTKDDNEMIQNFINGDGI